MTAQVVTVYGDVVQAVCAECRDRGQKHIDINGEGQRRAQEEARYHDEAYHPNGAPGDFAQEVTP